MTFSRFFRACALVLFVGGIGASAQTGVYGMVSGERVGDIACTDSTGRCASSDGKARPYGGTLGVYHDFRTVGPATLGLDFRASAMSTNKRADYYFGNQGAMRHFAFLGGARATFHTPFHVLRPYAQISGGLGRTNLAKQTGTLQIPAVYQNYGQVQGFAGLDLDFGSFVDIRAIEFGAGEMFGPNSHSLQQIGIGLVFHLPR